MKRCEKCGNAYEKSFNIIIGGEEHTFDCFECAISALAPKCVHCSCTIIGHGVEVNNKIFCCEHCAKVEEMEAA